MSSCLIPPGELARDSDYNRINRYNNTESTWILMQGALEEDRLRSLYFCLSEKFPRYTVEICNFRVESPDAWLMRGTSGVLLGTVWVIYGMGEDI